MPKEIIGFHISKDFAISSSPSRPCGNNVAQWLASFGDSLNIIYSLDYSASCLIRKMGLKREQCEHLLQNTKVWIDSLKTQITYIPSKFLAIKYGEIYNSPYAMFANADQYLLAVIEDGNQDWCFQKACEAQVVGKQVYEGLALMKVDAQNLISPINNFARTYFDRFNFPSVSDLPDQVGEYAFECLDAGWFDSPQKGAWAKTYDYDLASAYGSAISTVPNHRLGTWHAVKELTDAPMGFYKTNVTITAPFSPIGYRTKNFNYTPVGTWEKYLTRQQIDFIDKWKIGSVEIIDGMEWHPKELKFIYAPLMKRLYELKEANTGVKRSVIKRVITGAWGKSLEIRDGAFGDYFDPVTGALVEINTRLKVASLCFENNIVPLAVALDGIVTDRPLENIDLGSGLGQWKLAYEGKPAIIVNPDCCLISGKSSEQLFTLEYEWLKSEIEANPDAQEYTMVRKSPITLGKALQENKLDFLGDIVDTKRSVNVTVESKRMFPEMPSCGRDLLEHQYSSLPLSVDMIELSNIQDEEGLTSDKDDGILSIVPDEEFNLEEIE
jgi:hypothetical protein